MKRKNNDCSVALSYTFDEKPPIIIAKGKGEVAKKLNAIAVEHGIQLIKNPELANILAEQDIGACIPEETYEAIAGIFAFLDKTIAKFS